MKESRQKRTVSFCDDRNKVQMPFRPRTSAQNPLPQKFWVETAMGLFSAVLLAITVLVPEWFERLFDSTPDAGDGSTEWRLALSLAQFLLCCLALLGARGRSTSLPPLLTANTPY
jgi:hypothetical protein